jgi:hypothetical protein
MCDSLGNYVCAGTLKFGTPHNEYVFDAMIDRMWEIAQNRFGARCMRTCLESSHTPLYQKVRQAETGVRNSELELMVETNRYGCHPQLHPAGYQPEWSSALDLACRAVESTWAIWTFSESLLAAYRTSMHSQIGIADGLAK